MQTCQTTAVTEWNSLQTFKQFLYFVASTHLESESNFFFFFFPKFQNLLFHGRTFPGFPHEPTFLECLYSTRSCCASDEEKVAEKGQLMRKTRYTGY